MFTNKLAILMGLIIVASAQQAMANNKSYLCNDASNGQSFNFQFLDREPSQFEIGVYSGSASDLHPINAAIMSLPVKIQVSPLQTRTIVGINYSFALPNGTQVALTDVRFASRGQEAQLGIRGQATLLDNTVIALACE